MLVRNVILNRRSSFRIIITAVNWFWLQREREIFTRVALVFFPKSTAPRLSSEMSISLEFP